MQRQDLKLPFERMPAFAGLALGGRRRNHHIPQDVVRLHRKCQNVSHPIVMQEPTVVPPDGDVIDKKEINFGGGTAGGRTRTTFFQFLADRREKPAEPPGGNPHRAVLIA